MTTPKDSQAVTRANELLADSDATVEALKAALDGIREDTRKLNAQTLPELSQATSMAQRREIEAQREEVFAQHEILRHLYKLLSDAIQRRRAQDAMEGAEGDRAALEKSLEVAEKARAAYFAAAQDALDCAKVIADGRQAAGYPGYNVVGATAEQIDLLQDLAEPLLEGVALKRLRLTTQLGNPAKVA